MTVGRRPRPLIDRRAFIGSGIAAAAGMAAVGPMGRVFAQDIRGAKPSAVVDTTAGRLQGVELDGGVKAFYGVPYGASTAGENRFMPPKLPEPWPGIRPAVTVGHRSPQTFGGPISEVYALDRREPMGEDCLDLNVFTPGLGRGDRPVMVWLHGGGFTSGSGNWLLYDGARLARSQDVVVVPVTHRLNVFGYLYLAGLGDSRFDEASNVGMLDIVAALGWVRQNIDRFGGNPNNVTIFGQSGGGAKVSTLMGMPAAKGLFHRAIAMSGAMLQGVSPEAATETARKFMSALGARTPQEMQKLPMETVRDVYLRTPGLALSPVTDGRTLPSGPFTPGAPAVSADVPMIVGTVAQEINFFPNTPRDEIDNATLMSDVKRATGADDADAAHLVEVYRQGRPKASNIELYQTIASDASFLRQAPMAEAERKSEQGAAPVYVYYFTWQSPVHEGKLRAYHTLDIPFAFDNVEVAASMTGAANDRYALATKMSSAFATFARHGDPNCDVLPTWPKFDAKTRATMVFDDNCRVEDDPHKAERMALDEVRAKAKKSGAPS